MPLQALHKQTFIPWLMRLLRIMTFTTFTMRLWSINFVVQRSGNDTDRDLLNNDIESFKGKIILLQCDEICMKNASAPDTYCCQSHIITALGCLWLLTSTRIFTVCSLASLLNMGAVLSQSTAPQPLLGFSKVTVHDIFARHMNARRSYTLRYRHTGIGPRSDHNA